MDNFILLNILILGGIALFSSVILYIISKRINIKSNETASKIIKVLPNNNCGSCGHIGCMEFAISCAKSNQNNFSNLFCTVGGQKTMDKIALILGFKTTAHQKSIAVLRCQGDCKNAPAKINYEAVSSCRIANQIISGQSGCPDGCLHLGDCIKVCQFGALSLDPKTNMPVIDPKKCVSCGACVKACPRGLFEIRPLNSDGKLVYVACRNQQKGAIALKNCSKACIGCMKCSKINNLIKVENNLSYIPAEIDASAYGEKLQSSCPRGSIIYKENIFD